MKHVIIAAALAIALAGCTKQQQLQDAQIAAQVKIAEAAISTGIVVANQIAPNNATVATGAADVQKVEAVQAVVHTQIQTSAYTVVAGDCLSDIALKQTGSWSNWPGILNANSGQIQYPDIIRPGQVLTWQADQVGTPANKAMAYARAPYVKK